MKECSSNRPNGKDLSDRESEDFGQITSLAGQTLPAPYEQKCQQQESLIHLETVPLEFAFKKMETAILWTEVVVMIGGMRGVVLVRFYFSTEAVQIECKALQEAGPAFESCDRISEASWLERRVRPPSHIHAKAQDFRKTPNNMVIYTKALTELDECNVAYEFMITGIPGARASPSNVLQGGQGC